MGVEMNSKDEALKMAIEALEVAYDKEDDGYNALMYMKMLDAINACKEALEQPAQEPLTRAQQVIRANNKALEQPAQEPVAYVNNKFNDCGIDWRINPEDLEERTPLYTHPHQWKGLTDDEILERAAQIMVAKHYDKEKNT
jgi:hypothetical protein